MTFDDLIGTAMRLVAQTETLAALGARLTLTADGAAGDPVVTAQLDRVLGLLGVDLAGLSPAQLRQLAATIRAFFLQSAELLAAPGRAPGWVYEDPAVLQAQGTGSAMWPALVAHVEPLVERIARPGARLLDIGTGVALLAISACRTWPGLSVVGCDPWEPALALARRNIADAGLGDRIELRATGIEAIADEGAFDIAWIPAPFLPPSILELACARTHAALAPGGWAILGLYNAPPDPLAQALSELRVIRSGGAIVDPDRAAAMLAAAGFADARAVPRTWQAPMSFVIGQR